MTVFVAVSQFSRSETVPSPAKFGLRERSRNSCRRRSPPAVRFVEESKCQRVKASHEWILAG
jgi:hypothetical protein